LAAGCAQDALDVPDAPDAQVEVARREEDLAVFAKAGAHRGEQGWIVDLAQLAAEAARVDDTAVAAQPEEPVEFRGDAFGRFPVEPGGAVERRLRAEKRER